MFKSYRMLSTLHFVCVTLLMDGLKAATQYAAISENYFVGAQYGGDVDLLNTCAGTYCTDNAGCKVCTFPAGCRYGEWAEANCTANSVCLNPTSSKVRARCRFCWQTDPAEHVCEETRNCDSWDVRPVRTTCRVNPDVYCIGRRQFFKNVKCSWTNGYSWVKALFLSVTLGGLGVDRFYLGLWKSAIGKLFSFGGLGVWTLIDVVLIAVGYVGPADGSEYM